MSSILNHYSAIKRRYFAVFWRAAEIFCLIALGLLPNCFLITGAYGAPKSRTVVKPCPYDCLAAGMKGGLCRDWREGNKCYVELTEIPKDKTTRGGKSHVPDQSLKSQADPHPVPYLDTRVDKSDTSNLTPEQRAKVLRNKQLEICYRVHPYYLQSSSINIHNVKDAGYVNRGQFYVKGTINGMCIDNAGYYENGELVTEIPVTTSASYSSYQFSLKFRADSKPEIRVYPLRGERQVLNLTPPAKR